MVTFTCNICAAKNQVEQFVSEPATCACGSNVRLRALIHLLSLELFGDSIPLCHFPRLKAVRGLGMTDAGCYANLLEDKFSYTNTYYDREPRFDFLETHTDCAGTYDFILSADVLEHIAPPVDLAMREVHSLLKPHGFFGVTVFCCPDDQLREHFPELYKYRVIPLDGRDVLVNRRRDGTLEVRDDLTLHGGTGETLEMREFGISTLEVKLRSAGFRDVCFLTCNVPEWGILLDHDTSQPLVARKEPFVLDRCGQSQLIEAWREAARDARAAEALNERLARDAGAAREDYERLATQVRWARESCWLRLGRKLRVGPEFHP